MSWPIGRVAALTLAILALCASAASAANDPRFDIAPSVWPMGTINPGGNVYTIIGEGPKGFVLGLQWLRCDAKGADCQLIPGATAESFPVTAFDIDHTFVLRWTLGDIYGSSTRDSGPTPPVQPLPGRCTNRFDGTPVADSFSGSRGSDLFNGLAGDDTFRAGGSADCLNGGDGNDTLDGEEGSDTISGGLGNDTLIGGWGKDKIDGGPGNDRISLGFSGDRAIGGPGNDTINTANGYTDSADCGPGRDVVIADKRDRVRGCEKVRRKG